MVVRVLLYWPLFFSQWEKKSVRHLRFALNNLAQELVADNTLKKQIKHGRNFYFLCLVDVFVCLCPPQGRPLDPQETLVSSPVFKYVKYFRFVDFCVELLYKWCYLVLRRSAVQHGRRDLTVQFCLSFFF